MDISSLLAQLLNGLAGASTLFLVAAGLSLIFGVTRIVNFAHGSFYMLGLYLAYSCVERLGASIGFWPALLLAPVLLGLFGACVEFLLLRRIYQAPQLLQLLATFALALIVKDAALWLWGPEELFGPRALGLEGAVQLLGRRFPVYDLFLIAIGPLVLLLLTLLLTCTRWGNLIRAATQDREMLGALGVNQAWLFTSVFALGAFLAGLGGALQLPREPASLELDMLTIGAAFVVVVVGGMGSLPGAFLAALLIAQLKAVCIWLGVVQWGGFTIAFPKLTLIVEFVVMATVLMWRPWGLLGRAPAAASTSEAEHPPLPPVHRHTMPVGCVVLLALAALPWVVGHDSYFLVLLTDMAIAALFAASLYLIVAPGGMHSFGHAAYFGLGAYAAALLLQHWQLPFGLVLLLAPCLAAAGAMLYGWLCVRLSGVSLTMLTLALAQITWAIAFQWDDVTGGSNGLTGIWPPQPWDDLFYWLTLVVCAASLYLLWRMLHAPLGWALRAARDSVARAQAIGIDTRNTQWLAFIVAAWLAGYAGVLFVYSKGSIAPDALWVTKSVDGLVMVLLGGMHALLGPILGAVTFTWLHDSVARSTEYWRALLGGVMLLLVLLFPQGISGAVQAWQRFFTRPKHHPLA